MSLTRNDQHEYFWKGAKVPGVNEVLKDAGFIDDAWFTDEATLRGKHVHEACEFYDQDDLDFEFLHDSYKPYVEAYIKFRQDMPMNVVMSESMLYSKTCGFAGQLDRVFESADGSHFLIDIKTSAVKAKWWPIQLAAYGHLIIDQYPAAKLCSLRLDDKGRYDLSTPYFDVNNFFVFQSALVCYRWKRQ